MLGSPRSGQHTASKRCSCGLAYLTRPGYLHLQNLIIQMVKGTRTVAALIGRRYESEPPIHYLHDAHPTVALNLGPRLQAHCSQNRIPNVLVVRPMRRWSDRLLLLQDPDELGAHSFVWCIGGSNAEGSTAIKNPALVGAYA